MGSGDTRVYENAVIAHGDVTTILETGVWGTTHARHRRLLLHLTIWRFVPLEYVGGWEEGRAGGRGVGDQGEEGLACKDD